MMGFVTVDVKVEVFAPEPPFYNRLALSTELLNYIIAFATQGKNGHYKLFDS